MPSSTMSSNQGRIGGTMGTVLRGSASENARQQVPGDFCGDQAHLLDRACHRPGCARLLSNLVAMMAGRAAQGSGPHAIR